jgi:ABC-type lipoprotein export system ATPase subunit
VNDVAVEAVSLAKIYPGNPPVSALRDATLQVLKGERVAILGRSGAGKSTLLNILGLLDAPTSGSYRLLGRDTSQLGGRARDRMRAERLGFVFQSYHVLGRRTVTENVMLKLTTARVGVANREDLTRSAIENVGLSHRAHALGQTLSGGEKQRLAVARAIVTTPPVLLADEPTGNLDDTNARAVLDLFDEQARRDVAVIVITHDDRTARWADRVVELKDGRVVGA